MLRDRIERDQHDEQRFRLKLHGFGLAEDGSDGLPPTDQPGNPAYQQMRALLAQIQAR